MTMSEVIDLMKSSRSESEWNANRDHVKRMHDGKYPDYWYGRIMIGGVLSETKAKW